MIAPYSAEDARGLLKAAIRDDNPVVFLENEILYGMSFDVSEECKGVDFTLPIGECKIERAGTDVTLVSYSRGVHTCLEAADALAKDGVSCEVINIRTLRPLDRKTIIDSVIKTNRLVTVEEGWPACGIGAELGACIYESDVQLPGRPGRAGHWRRHPDALRGEPRDRGDPVRAERDQRGAQGVLPFVSHAWSHVACARLGLVLSVACGCDASGEVRRCRRSSSL